MTRNAAGLAGASEGRDCTRLSFKLALEPDRAIIEFARQSICPLLIRYLMGAIRRGAAGVTSEIQTLAASLHLKACVWPGMSDSGSQRMKPFTARSSATSISGAIAITLISGFLLSSGMGSERTSTIERGRYLVKTTGCNDCHTPGYAEKAGHVDESRWLTGDRLGWQGPWGTTYPPNLRLLVQNISAEEWLQIARRPTRPPMPWFALRDMTDEDLLAIYTFARSLGPAGKPAPPFLPPGQEPSTPVVKVPPPPQ